jgi:hypothetical protein
MEKEQCSSCKFWDQGAKSLGDVGECHRYAPRLIMAGCGIGENPEYNSTWCGTDGVDWCGEYKEKP